MREDEARTERGPFGGSACEWFLVLAWHASHAHLFLGGWLVRLVSTGGWKINITRHRLICDDDQSPVGMTAAGLPFCFATLTLPARSGAALAF